MERPIGERKLWNYFVRSAVFQLIGAALLIVGLAALIKPDLEFAEWALNDESGRSHNEIIVFYIASGSCLVLVATVGFCGACHYQYGVLTAVGLLTSSLYTTPRFGVIRSSVIPVLTGLSFLKKKKHSLRE